MNAEQRGSELDRISSQIKVLKKSMMGLILVGTIVLGVTTENEISARPLWELIPIIIILIGLHHVATILKGLLESIQRHEFSITPMMERMTPPARTYNWEGDTYVVDFDAAPGLRFLRKEGGRFVPRPELGKLAATVLYEGEQVGESEAEIETVSTPASH